MSLPARKSPLLAPFTLVREATAVDNCELLSLAASCSMRGDISLRIERQPDFFALNRLEGLDSRVWVVDASDRLAGCIATIFRDAYINGQRMRTGYVGDLKVHPRCRNTVTADSLCNFAGGQMDQLASGTPTLVTVLAGNRPMEKRLPGPRGVPAFDWIATIRSHSIPVLWKRQLNDHSTVKIERARWRDLDQMVRLWSRVSPSRQFGPIFDSNSLADWIRLAPGLDISSYLVARSCAGEVVGFVALWDQSSFKQMYVERYSRQMSIVAALNNIIAPRFGGARLAAPGEQMRYQTAVHVCVPGETPEILHSLLIAAHNQLRNTGFAFFNVGLDIVDPLSIATSGLFGQSTDIGAYVSTRGSVPLDLDMLRSRPLHYEIALV
ncbi:MAG TPA: hypothetical protein VM053_05540 [Gemmatimonadaceae bacterium]|nr:hypothetical protein [Gemmatimonadaceae bacterium]